MDTYLDFLRDYVYGLNWQGIAIRAIRILVILLLFRIASKLLGGFLKRVEGKLIKEGVKEGEPPSESRKRVETILRLVRQGMTLLLCLVMGLMILNQIGLNIAPLLAGAGVLGVALGFGAQNLVRDVIAGFFIILENQIRIGDVAIINNTGGLVQDIRFRTTVLRDLGGVVHVFPNGTIDSLSNMTNEWSAYVFDIGIAYKEDTDKVIELMREVGAKLKQDPDIGYLMLEEPEIFGVDDFADSAVVIKGRIKTLPIRQWQVGREYLRRVKYAFDENDIEIPFPHTSLYVGEDSKPFEINLLDKLANHPGHTTDR